MRAASWGGFVYVTLFSMWLGFFAWYRGLTLGGVVLNTWDTEMWNAQDWFRIK